VYNKSTDKIAVFHHAALWSWASPPETGNFVPEGESAPEGTFAPRMCVAYMFRFASYAINTEEDSSFYDGAKARIIEKYVTNNPEFNKHKKRRRGWQDGTSDFARRRFIFAARLVVRRTPYNSRQGEDINLPYKLHPWLEAAIASQKHQVFMANPEMPTILEYENQRLKLLRPTHYRYFQNGDVVWFSFALSFDINNSNWMPEFKPLDFVRVGNV
ncbi:hypothetical protein B0H11DRAFT_1681587, partial [Mycena galericulata]